jgi:Restriction endonuclease
MQLESKHPRTGLKVFYIKLGRGGTWESNSISTGKLRIGWSHQSVDDINAKRWDVIEDQIRSEHPDKRQVATNDLNRLRDIAESSPEDVWITFHQAKLWWARLNAGPVEQDEISKFRRIAGAWTDKSATGRLLVINELPGRISQLQGFRGTVCKVQHHELLQRVIDGVESELAKSIASHRSALAGRLEQAIKELHWKDFETLADLVFREAGWIRVSVLGQQAKGYDLELREPITGDRYVVQVKSRASLQDLRNTASEFSEDDYRKVFFVVHSPDDDLLKETDLPVHIELVLRKRLAELAIDAGLSGWLQDKMT